jgi:hypothetical protein
MPNVEEVRKMSNSMEHFGVCFWNKNIFFFSSRETEKLSYNNVLVKPFFLQVKQKRKVKIHLIQKNLFLDEGDITFCTIWRFYPKPWISRPFIKTTFCEKLNYFTKGSMTFHVTIFTEHLIQTYTKIHDINEPKIKVTIA